MKAKTKLLALGAIGAAAYGVARTMRHRKSTSQTDVDSLFDTTDLEDPVIVTEEVVVITEAGPYEVDLELIPATRGTD